MPRLRTWISTEEELRSRFFRRMILKNNCRGKATCHLAGFTSKQLRKETWTSNLTKWTHQWSKSQASSTPKELDWSSRRSTRIKISLYSPVSSWPLSKSKREVEVTKSKSVRSSPSFLSQSNKPLTWTTRTAGQEQRLQMLEHLVLDTRWTSTLSLDQSVSTLLPRFKGEEASMLRLITYRMTKDFLLTKKSWKNETKL